jgi:Spx/MgsR family transcriptional regulator
MITLYGIANCDTVKRARAWLAEHGLQVRFHDFKRDGLPADVLERWLRELGRDRLVNRQGLTWRRLDETQRALAQTDDGTCRLLSAHSSLVKRPVMQWSDGQLSVGFDAEDWQRRLR